MEDLEVVLGFPQKKTEQVKARIITYMDPQTQKYLEFLTNDFRSQPTTISQLYAKRGILSYCLKGLSKICPSSIF